jgi:hypothetical protein
LLIPSDLIFSTAESSHHIVNDIKNLLGVSLQVSMPLSADKNAAGSSLFYHIPCHPKAQQMSIFQP